MKASRSHRKLFLSIGLIFSIISASSLSFGIYYISDNFKTTSVVNYIFWDGVEHIEDDIYGVDIREISITGLQSEQEEPLYYLGNDGIRELKVLIKQRLGFGPQFFSLNGIYIMDDLGASSLINGNEDGVYYSETKHIILNTNTALQEAGLAEIRNGEFQFKKDISSVPAKARAELIFPVLYHEFLHHVANESFTNLSLDSENAYPIYSQKDGEDGKYNKHPWNKKFINSFKENLNYDQPTDPKDKVFYSDDFVEYNNNKITDGNMGYGLPAKNYIKSIGSIYTAADLFDKSNLNEPSDYNRLLDNLNDGSNDLSVKNFGYGHVSLDSRGWSIPIYNETNLQNFQYLYSMQELFVRKYQQLTMTNYEVFYENGIDRLITEEGYIIQHDNSLHATQYLKDTLNYQSGFDIKRGKSIDWNNDGIFDDDIYLQDAPLATNERGTNLMNAFNSVMGQKEAADISFIWNELPLNLEKKSDGGSLERNILDPKIVDSSSKNIKFGGFFNSEESRRNFKYVGYWSDNNHTRFVSYPITTYEYIFNKVLEVGGSSRQEYNKNVDNNHFYVTSGNWINANDITNKNLYFSPTTNPGELDVMALNNIKSESNGSAGNRRFFDIDEMKNNNNYYQPSLINGNVQIKQIK